MSIKRITDELGIAGQALTCDEVITYLLATLSRDYASLVASITAHVDPITLEVSLFPPPD